jgi:endonuclease/exonuclease/phosphatase family metal-dependent hydrolase
MKTLSILSWNTLLGGRDASDDRRARAQIKVIDERKPDILVLQELRGFDAHGGSWMYAIEAQLGMRGFLATAPRTGHHIGVFIRPWLRPLRFDIDHVNFHHTLAVLDVTIPGRENPLSVIGAHLCPSGAQSRRREAACLGTRATPDRWTIIAGDLNTCSPHDPEPDDWHTLQSHHRIRYLADDLQSIDRSALAHLEAAGWVDLGHMMGAASHPTVPTSGFRGGEFPTMRCDYLLASRGLAGQARTYEVLRNHATDGGSDHYPLMGTFAVY